MNKPIYHALIAMFFITAGSMSVAADLRFSRHYSNNMVLQREKPVLIRGFADKGAEVKVSFAGQEKTGKADDAGSWEVTLDPIAANPNGQTLTLSLVTTKHSEDGAPLATRPLTLDDVVVGDVFLFARQTTIDISLGRDEIGRKAAAGISANPLLRVMSINTIPALNPQPDLAKDATSGWAVLGKAQALQMSAAAFYFGRDLAAQTKVPIGIIDLNMGLYFPMAWMSREALLETGEVFGRKQTVVERQVEFFDGLVKEYDRGDAQEKQVAPDPLLDPRFPAAGFNAVMHPLRGMALKAILLQLGNNYPYTIYEKAVKDGTNLDRAILGQAYKDTYLLRKWCIYLEPYTTPRLAGQWRTYFGDRDLPVGLIMPPASDLSTMALHHVEMRELQRRAAANNAGVGLILPGNKHIPFSAQPADEVLLAKRCLLWVLGDVFHEPGVTPSGPLFDRVEAKYSQAQIFFKPGTADGLTAGKGALVRFEVAGTELEYSPAQAAIDGSTIRLKSDTVSRIVYVRYNWCEKPDQGLLNSAGLPAIPFRTDNHAYPRVIGQSEKDLPDEYSTLAKNWKGGDVAIISGSTSGSNWGNGEGILGVTGIMTGPFGPNMLVNYVLPGAPADGKILPGDIIYEVSGELLGKDPLHEVSEAITYAESEAGGGKISFGLRRAGKNMTVDLQIEVLGVYSSTSPYNCPKADRIVANMEAFLADRGGVMGRSHPVFRTADAMFLLAAGTPKYQGLVRRAVYRIMTQDITKPIDVMKPDRLQHPWVLAYNALLLGEYYMATGDRNVLPYLKWSLDWLAVLQVKVETEPVPWTLSPPGAAGGWRHNLYGRSTYGMLPPIGIPAMLGFYFAKEAGLDIDDVAYQRGLGLFRHSGVEVGKVGYGIWDEPVTVPKTINPEALAAGKLSSSNGAIALAGVLFNMLGDKSTAHICSFISMYSYNNTHGAHGGNFWNNCWTPMGARVQGKEAFIFFMKNYRWYQELNRMYNHSYYQGDRGKIGGGQLMALVVPRERLRILGAPESVFAVNPKEILRPSLDAYFNRDYAGCEKQIAALIETGTMGGADSTKALQLQRVAKELQESIELDMTKVEGLISENKFYEARLDLRQLKGVVAADNARLAAIEKTLTDPAIEQALAKDRGRYAALQKSLEFQLVAPKRDKEEAARWQSLTTASRFANRSRGSGIVAEESATKWRMKLVESIDQAPKGWTAPKFDDSTWGQTTLPISWHMNHTAILRSSFEIQDKQDIDALRIRMWIFRQQNIEVYINGTHVAMINKIGGNMELNAPLTDGAVRALKNGRNTIAVTFRHDWRWGRYFSRIETAGGNSVYNNGVTLMLDKREKQK